MRLICPNCDAQYEVADDAIPPEGRDVQCSNCGHAWFQQHPETEMADAAEAAIFDPEPAPEPVSEDLPDPIPDLPEPEPLVAADAVPLPDLVPPPLVTPIVVDPLAARRRVDENVLAVLREEAEFEARARARDLPRPLETQGDLGLDSLPPIAISPAAQQIAARKDIEAEPAEPAIRTPKGRDLLPDIEEINSTLRPAAINEEFPADMAVPVARQAGFRAGFVGMVVVAVLLAMAYLLAPRLMADVPALAGVLKGYVALVDAARLALDGAIQKAIGLIQG